MELGKSQEVAKLSDVSNKDKDAFVQAFVKELHNGTAAIFAGAGLSVGSGFVDWVGLLKPLAESMGLDAARESDHLVALAQHHVNENGMSRSQLHKQLLEEIPTDAKPTKNHHLLARLPITAFWTTNYDHLLETALVDAGKIVDAKHRVDQLAFTKPRRDAVVYKMHGDIEHPAQIVITKDDYERYSLDRGAFINALTGDLVSKTFLFLGFSFKDPNLDYVLARIRLTFQANGRQHYCLFRRVLKQVDQSQAEFEYLQTKQQLAVNDLKRFNVKTLLVDSYDEITVLLARIDQTYRRKTIFISGSAEQFGLWREEDVSEFLYELGKIIIQRGFRLVSGFGWGISNDLLSGAIEQIYGQRLGHIQDHLIVRPFPRKIADQKVRDALWGDFRRDLISQAGISIFMFGNKLVDGKVTLSDGVRKEYEIARSLDLVTVPLASTGYVASELWALDEQRVVSSEMSAEIKQAYAALQLPASKPRELLSRLSLLLELLAKE
jgi:Sir2- and TIR-associating SLOG family/SIR2-like domain